MVRPDPEVAMLYYVESVSNPGRPHVVDFKERGGAGCCTCLDWCVRRQPALDRGEPIHSETTLCKHQKAALAHFTRTLFPVMAKQCKRTANY